MSDVTGDDGMFAEILTRARPYLQTRHNELHTLISLSFAEHLLELEGGDAEVVIPAVLLHDIGWSRVPEEEQLLAFGPNVKDPELTKVHERAGATLAESILRDLGWPENAVAKIVHVIAGHDTRVGSGSLEESLVRDADKLFRVSAEGFRIDVERFGRDPVAYLGLLESKVDDWFFTVTGAGLAREELRARRRELQEKGLAAG